LREGSLPRGDVMVRGDGGRRAPRTQVRDRVSRDISTVTKSESCWSRNDECHEGCWPAHAATRRWCSEMLVVIKYVHERSRTLGPAAATGSPLSHAASSPVGKCTAAVAALHRLAARGQAGVDVDAAHAAPRQRAAARAGSPPGVAAHREQAIAVHRGAEAVGAVAPCARSVRRQRVGHHATDAVRRHRCAVTTTARVQINGAAGRRGSGGWCGDRSGSSGKGDSGDKSRNHHETGPR